MTAHLVEPDIVGSSSADDVDRPHAVCVHRDVTWCGVKADGFDVVPVPDCVSKVCPVCVLAMEMWDGTVCPVCGCLSCMS